MSIKQSNSISYDNNYFWSVLPGIMGIKSTCSWTKWQNHPWPLTTTPVSHLKRQPGSRWHSSSAFTMPMDILSPKLGCFWASGKGRDWFANWKQLILTCATIHRGWAQLYVTTCLQLHLSHVKTCKSKCMLHDYIIDIFDYIAHSLSLCVCIVCRYYVHNLYPILKHVVPQPVCSSSTL